MSDEEASKVTVYTGAYSISATPHTKQQWDYWRQLTDKRTQDEEREDEEEAA